MELKSLKLLLRRIRHINVSRMFDMIERVHKESGKLRIVILIDMIVCAFTYNVGYLDYYVFGFVFCNKEERKTFMTMPINNNLFKTLNDPVMRDKFDDKLEFNRIFDKYLGRDWLDLRTASKEDFMNFCKKHDVLFVKPVDAFSGKGIEKISLDGKNPEEVYQSLLEHKQYVVEECLKQHPKMNEMNPTSINTLRITSLRKGDTVHIMYILLRTSDGTKFIDNIGSGGFYAPVGFDGIIYKPGFTEQDGVHERHPYTNTPFVGFEVPMVKEAMELVKTAASLTPSLRYCGWDVAICEHGPVLIEGNPMPGYDIPQNHFHLIGKTGRLPQFKEILQEEI
ncbi:MAG: hypothetical protein HUJ58_06490 [Erysipelotrichaceae bacterium]|nr:hypothetical protein [Erysipelotrichaceae bacterium]